MINVLQFGRFFAALRPLSGKIGDIRYKPATLLRSYRFDSRSIPISCKGGFAPLEPPTNGSATSVAIPLTAASVSGASVDTFQKLL